MLCSTGPMAVNPPSQTGAPGLTDRFSECAVLDRFVDEVRAGEGRALVVRGEAGVGKTALLEYLAGRACDGYSNSEIGSELFLSPRTVEWHLRKVFTKLGIGSCRQLREALPNLGQVALPA
jgi:DNA-binding CsgD family transcriptional regulator